MKTRTILIIKGIVGAIFLLLGLIAAIYSITDNVLLNGLDVAYIFLLVFGAYMVIGNEGTRQMWREEVYGEEEDDD